MINEQIGPVFRGCLASSNRCHFAWTLSPNNYTWNRLRDSTQILPNGCWALGRWVYPSPGGPLTRIICGMPGWNPWKYIPFALRIFGPSIGPR
jgi:hypothetical protein